MTAHSTSMEGLGRSNESRGAGFWEIISKALKLHTVLPLHQLIGEFLANVLRFSCWIKCTGCMYQISQIISSSNLYI